MGNTLIYLFQASVCLAVFYLIYWIFFRSNTFFRINRIYLLSSIIVSLLIPIFNFSPIFGAQNYPFVFILDPINIYAERIAEVEKTSNYLNPISTTYFIGLLLFTTLFIFKIYRIIRIIKKFGIKKIGNYRFVFTDNDYPSFSFLNYIFVSNTQENNDFSKIIDHEKIHIKQLHTIDILLLEIVTIIFWFNPILLAYKNSIKGVHEYLADEGVINNGHKTSDYQQLLLSLSFGLRTNALTNNFNHLLIKKRFIMMTKIKSPNWSKFRYILFIPALVTLFIAFSCDEKNNENVSPVKNTESEELVTDDVDEKVFDFYELEAQPEFPGGMDEISKWLGENLIYPEEARENGITGKVFAQFIIDKDGSVSDVKIMRSVNPLLDEEVIRVLNSMPKWTPGKQDGENVKVTFQIPVNFQLN